MSCEDHIYAMLIMDVHCFLLESEWLVVAFHVKREHMYSAVLFLNAVLPFHMLVSFCNLQRLQFFRN